MSSIIRSLARNRAKENMKRKGMVQICKKGKRNFSWFSDHWREYVVMGRVKGGH